MSTLVVTNLSLGAGGLPDGSVLTDDIADNAITTAKIAAGAVVAADLSGNQSGSAPIYGARAWVNFNGTGTVAINASGNVSSISDFGVGRYGVNMTTALPDANYAVVGTSSYVNAGTNSVSIAMNETTAPTTTAFRVRTNYGSTDVDPLYASLAILR